MSEYCGCISQAGVDPRILILVFHFCKNFFHGCRHRSPFRDRLCSKSESLEWIQVKRLYYHTVCDRLTKAVYLNVVQHMIVLVLAGFS